MFLKTILFIIMFFVAIPVSKAQVIDNKNDSPIEISAGQSLEWHQKDLQYIARGDVIVTQGNTTIKSTDLVADYREGAESKTEIWQITATGNVTISDSQNVLTGDNGIYNIDQGLATVTGSNLTLTSPEQIITATEKMEYSITHKKASALGNATVSRGEDKLYADQITSFFEQDATGKDTLTKIETNSNVKITTPMETLTGNKGIYNAKTNIAEVQGNVIIIRGPNKLEGNRAEVNLTTNVSRIFGDEKQGQRVKGIFFPSTKKQ